MFPQTTNHFVWFTGSVLPYFCGRPVKNPSIWKESITWIVPRRRIVRGWNLEGYLLVADFEELETMDASEIYSKRLNAKEGIFPKQGEFIFPIADGRIKLLGGDQDLRTSPLIPHRPIQGESHLDFLGESEGSLPQPQDSFPDAGEAINDFWSMSENFIYRHHVEPRVKLYSPRDESFPFPLKYIEVSRTTRKNLDVMQERRIDDYWNIDGSRDLSDPWTGFTQFTLLDEKAPEGYMWSGWRLTGKQLTSRPDHLCEVSKDIVDNYRAIFESRISVGGTEKYHARKIFVFLHGLMTWMVMQRSVWNDRHRPWSIS